MDELLREKMIRLKRLLEHYGSVAVALSGGVDSTFLAKASRDVLGGKTAAITVDSEAYPPLSIEDTRTLARLIGIRLIEIPTRACDIPGFAENGPERCYHCKKALFTLMLEKAREAGLSVLIDGSNADDASDYRPGMRALSELGVKSPLMEAGFTKRDIRTISHELGLSTWDRQSSACLASRFPYGSRITPELLERTWRAEAVLKNLGMKRFRVRNHGDLARIEIDPEDMNIFFTNDKARSSVVERLKSLGFTYVALDLSGYRTGSMNEALMNADKVSPE